MTVYQEVEAAHAQSQLHGVLFSNNLRLIWPQSVSVVQSHMHVEKSQIIKLTVVFKFLEKGLGRCQGKFLSCFL